MARSRQDERPSSGGHDAGSRVRSHWREVPGPRREVQNDQPAGADRSLRSAIEGARREIVACPVQGGTVAVGSDLATDLTSARRRGVEVLVLLGVPALLTQDDVRSRVALWCSDGVEVRTAPRLLGPSSIIIDSHSAFLFDEDRTWSSQTEDPSLVSLLRSSFELQWSGAIPLPSSLDPVEIAADRAVLDALCSGATDTSAARVLNFSVRTYRRRVASILRRLGARSRFEAGALARRRGWL